MENDSRKTDLEIEELKMKYMLLQHECRCQRITIGRQEVQMMKLRSQLKNQAQFCSKTGASLGYYLWKATQIPDIVYIMLREDKIRELSQIMANVLKSFIDTYQTKTPISNTDEIRFVLSAIGLVANLTTVELGQKFFSKTDSGKHVIRLIMSLVPQIPSPSGNQLKKISYCALYNVSIYLIGSPSQIINTELVKVLNDEIKVVNNTIIEPEIRLYALKLLQALIRNICTKTTYNIIKNNIQESHIVKLASAEDIDTETVARSILNDLSKAKEQFETDIIMS